MDKKTMIESLNAMQNLDEQKALSIFNALRKTNGISEISKELSISARVTHCADCRFCKNDKTWCGVLNMNVNGKHFCSTGKALED